MFYSKCKYVNIVKYQKKENRGKNNGKTDMMNSQILIKMKTNSCNYSSKNLKTLKFVFCCFVFVVCGSFQPWKNSWVDMCQGYK